MYISSILSKTRKILYFMVVNKLQQIEKWNRTTGEYTILVISMLINTYIICITYLRWRSWQSKKDPQFPRLWKRFWFQSNMPKRTSRTNERNQSLAMYCFPAKGVFSFMNDMNMVVRESDHFIYGGRERSKCGLLD